MKHFKTIIQFLLLSAIATLFFACGTAKQATQKLTQDREVVILAINDMHASVDRFPQFAYMIDSLRNIYPDMLLVAAGDNQTGHPVNDQYNPKGLPMIALMNAVKFDVTAVGNHEFDTGEEGFALLTRKANFDFLAANVVPPIHLDMTIKPYKIFTLKNGVKVAIVSLLQINNKGIPDCHPDYAKNFSFTDPFKVGKQYMFLKNEADILVYLNHLGIEGDVPLAKLLSPEKVDLIIGGHSHTKIDKEQIHNGILITQAKNKVKYATLIKMRLTADGKINREMELLPIRKNGKENVAIRKMVDDFTNDNPSLIQQIATAEADFTAKEQIGYLMTDALFSAADVDIALLNSGGARIESMDKGKVSPKEVYLMDPFSNEVALINLTGKELQDCYVAAYHADEYGIVYATGLKSKYIFNGDKLKDIQLFTNDNKPIDYNKTYRVAMNSYMLSATKFDHKDPGQSLFKTTADNMIEYLKKLGTIKSYQNEKRIEIIKN